MLAKVWAPAHVGMDGVLVEIECDITNGLPSFVVVGLGNQAVSEARDRVRGAIRNSRLMLPPKRVTLNLAPADLPKDGTAYDLGIAMAVLVASEQLESVGGSLFAGELALDGSLRPIPGALSYAQLAAAHGLKQIFVPAPNAAEAALIGSITVYGARTLLEIFAHLTGLEPLVAATAPKLAARGADATPDLARIYGQPQAKRALEIVAAGGHNLLLSGPPGAGKTMLSRALIGILPPPSLDEMIEITKLYGLAAKVAGEVITRRPFRNPHHTASDIALIGGGRVPRPGEISLSHHGVLFLDELPEFRRDVLEALRQPLEDGVVTVARASGVVTFPAAFILVAAQNPCACGYAGDPVRRCVCTQAAISRYANKVSGPLLDRIDLIVPVNRVDLNNHQAGKEPSRVVAARIAAARRLGFRSDDQPVLNARLPDNVLRQACPMNTQAAAVLRSATAALSLSARGYVRTLKVARTVANLDGREIIESPDVTEAIGYRPRA